MANNTREKKYEIQDRAGKGRALIAILPIERGDVIIEEKPIFTISYGKISPKEVDNALDKLEDQVAINKQWLEESSTNREAFFRLSYQGKEENRKYWRLKTNCFSFRGNQEKGSGHMVYDEISYANHSCAPNALVEVDQEWTLRGTLRCIRNIAAGEEIVIAYHANLVTAEQRAEM